jgi:hypothetical protein
MEKGLFVWRLEPFVPSPFDVNGDGRVDNADMTMLLESWSNCPETCSADINQNGHLEVADAVLLLNQLGDLETR